MGSIDPKALVKLNGTSLLARSIETIISSGVASTIVVAAPEEFLLRVREEIDSISVSKPGESRTDVAEIRITAVAGGEDRIESVQLALKHAEAADIVLVHDAARALTPPEVFRRVAAAVHAGAEAVVPVLPMTDTVRRVETRSVQEIANSRRIEVESDVEIDQNLPSVEVLHGDLDRSSLRRVQTPQGFVATTLRRAHERYLSDAAEPDSQTVGATDDAGLVDRLGVDVVAVDGDEEALKITYPLDLVLGEHIAAMRDETMRDGTMRAQTMRAETMRDETSERGGQR